MRWSMRSLFVVCVVTTLVLGVMPQSAFGALSVTWERNWGELDDTAPYADGSFFAPTDVAVDKWGNVYVAGGFSGDDRIQMFTADGVFVEKYDASGTAAGQLKQPRTLATDRWGSLYVGQQGNDRIEVFHPELYGHSHTIETPATPLHDVAGLDVALDGRIFNTRQWVDVQVRERSGELITSVTPPTPMGIGVSQDNELYVAVDEDGTEPDNMIGVYNPDLSMKWAWGGPGAYLRPFDIDLDPACNVFVVEWTGSRAQVLSQNSDPLDVFGEALPWEERFAAPMGICTGLDRTVYVADTSNSRISKWNVTTPAIEAEVEGANRYLTAIEASKKAYPDGADVAVLATGENWPDALGGAALAGVLDGPLLLTPRDVLPASVAAELDRLNVKGVYVLGGTGAVSDDVLNAAKALTPLGAAERLGGINRYETANAIAARVVSLSSGTYDGAAFVCTGEDFPDALAAAPIAAANGWPIYLTQTAALTPSTKTAMQANTVTHGFMIGGTGAVSAAVETELDAAFIDFSRIGGANRYDTAAKLATEAFEGMGMLWSRPALATGLDFPDALAGGVLQGSDYSVLLLTRGTTLSPEAATALTANRKMIYELRYLGGDGVLSPGVRSAARALVP